VHRDLTEVLAEAAGAPSNIASEIAAANQEIDDNPATSPMGMTPFGEAVKTRANYHFTTSERRAEMLGNFSRSGKIKDLGAYLHALQDSYSHAGFGPSLGHAAQLHEPDKTYNDRKKANLMAEASYDAIRGAKGTFLYHGQAVTWGPGVPWGKIKIAVNDFNRAPTPALKARALKRLRDIIRENTRPVKPAQGKVRSRENETDQK